MKWLGFSVCFLLLAACGATTAPTGDAVSCGEGTTLKSNRCEAIERCGSGTRSAGGVCEPVSGLTCGTGTRLEGSACIPTSNLHCGSNTQQQGDACVSTVVALTCGEGTSQSGTRCIANGTQVTCGAGTALQSGSCRVDLSAVCASGTMGAGGTQCVPSLASLCGTGTEASGGKCALAASACGAGSTLDGGKCVVNVGALCGPGTVFQNNRCELPSSNTSLNQLAAAVDLKRSVFRGLTVFRTMLSNISQSAGDDWTQVLAAPVGTGDAVHLIAGDRAFYYSNDPDDEVFTVEDSSNGTGACSSFITPNSVPSSASKIRVNFFGWASGAATQKACGKAGSVRFKRNISASTGDYTSITAIFNVAFTDGTVWQDKTLTLPYR